MSETPTWLAQTHDAQRELRGVAIGLQRLASCFAGTGNQYVADELYAFADSVYCCEKAITDATFAKLKEGCEEGERFLATTISAALAVCERSDK
jgi:hypothetical protein